MPRLPHLLLAATLSLPSFASAQNAPQPQLTNDSIVKMAKAGLSDDLLIQTINTEPGHYATTPDDLIALKQDGLSQAVISAMLGHNSGLAPHPATSPFTVAPLSPDIDENGIYHQDCSGKWVMLSPELVHYKSGGWAKSTFTHDIVKKDRNGEVSGPQAPVVLQPGDQILILAPPSTDAVEYQLLRFRLHPNSREFRATTGGIFNSHDGTERDLVPIQPTRLAPRVFSFTIPNNIGGGEYGVLPPGNASTPGIAFAGKIYTFAITEAK